MAYPAWLTWVLGAEVGRTAQGAHVDEAAPSRERRTAKSQPCSTVSRFASRSRRSSRGIIHVMLRCALADDVLRVEQIDVLDAQPLELARSIEQRVRALLARASSS